MQMRVQFEGDAGDRSFIDAMTKVVALLGGGTVTIENGFDGTEVPVEKPNGAATAAPKRGRRAAAPAAPEPETDAISDTDLIDKVKAFGTANPTLRAEIRATVARYGVDAVSKIPADQRTDFLSEMNDLAAFT